MKIIISFYIFFVVFNLKVLAQFGTLIPDSTFHYTSTVVRDSFETNKLIVINDGRILCIGSINQMIAPYVFNKNFSISCFLPNGTIDNSFANNGYLTIDCGYNDGAFWHIENFDSGYLIIGYYNITQNTNYFYKAPSGDCLMIKIDQSGNFDLSFGNNGIKHLLLNPKFNIADIKFSQNNDIFLLINQQFYFGYTDKGKIVKLNSHGVLVTGFGIMGIAELPIYLPQSMNILADGSFVVLAADTSNQLQYPFQSIWQSPQLCKLDQFGNIDMSYGINGKKVISFGNSGFVMRTSLSFNNGFYMYGEEGYHGSSTYVPQSLYKFNNFGNFDNSFSVDGRVAIKVTNNSSLYSFPLYNQAMKIFNNDLWLFGITEINAMNCDRKQIIRVNEYGVQDTTLGNYHFSPEPIFDHVLDDSSYSNTFINCFEYSGWNDICFQDDGKILAAGYVGTYDSTITTIPNGYIISRLMPENPLTSDGNNSREISIFIYPNPASVILNIKATCKQAKLTDITGKILFIIQFENDKAQLNISGLDNGIYFLIPKVGKASKIIIQQ